MPNEISNHRSARCRIAVAALAMTALIPVATALADAPDGSAAPQVVVKYADLDLTSDADAAVLLRRIEAAARQVCGDPREVQPLVRLMPVRQCNTQAIEHAVAALGAPKVTLAYRVRYSSTGIG
jgi:UrcA family protein